MSPENVNTVAIPQGTNGDPVVVRIPNPKSPIWHWLISAIVALGSMITSGYMAYAHNSEGVQTRLTIIETQQKSYDSRLGRIEDKLDQLLLLQRGK